MSLRSMQNSIIVRPVAATDVDRLIEFNLRMAEETEGKQLDSKVLACGVKAVLEEPKRGFYLVAEVDGEVAGSLMVTTEWSDWRNSEYWWIQSVYVHKSWRQKGIFTQLFKAIKKIAQKNDIEVLRLYVYNENVKAKETYIASGMKEKTYSIYQISLEP